MVAGPHLVAGGKMRAWIPLIVIVSLVHGNASATSLQITDNPLPDSIEKTGLEVEIRDLVRLPETLGMLPPHPEMSEWGNPAGWARVSYVRDLPDDRRFVNDARGFLYLLNDTGQPVVYLDFASLFPFAVYHTLSSGLSGFAFHPDFSENGLFYTAHHEIAAGNPSSPDFIPPGFTQSDVTFHNIVTEWRTVDPSADRFEGTRRELLRVPHVVGGPAHLVSSVEFNPTAIPGDDDYALLYINGTDFGFSNGQGPNARNPGQLQRLDTLVGAILRIVPRSPSVSGGTGGLGDYTIPIGNRFAADGDTSTLGEIYAYGFRNAHRLSWDLTDGTMFASDIGMNHIEEINIVRNGENYGWMAREGYFENGMTRPGGALNQLYPLPGEVLNGEIEDEFTYPVVIYDHDEGRAISGGFAYYGRIDALRGRFIFGDLTQGRIFASDLEAMKAADDGIPVTVAPVEEVQLYVRDENGMRRDVTFMELVEGRNGTPTSRADLHFSRSRDGELFITSRQDGMVRMLVPDSNGLTRRSP